MLRISLFKCAFCQSDVVLSCVVLVVVDDAAHVRHAAVANFHVVLVKDGVQIVAWCEVFLDQVEEGFSYVGLDIFAVWGVKQDDVSISISFLSSLQQAPTTVLPNDVTSA